MKFLHVMHANEDVAWHDNGALPPCAEKEAPSQGAADALTSEVLSNETLTSAFRRQTIRSLSHGANGDGKKLLYAVMMPLWAKLLRRRR